VFPLRDNIKAERATPVTYALIVANVLVYFLWQKGGLSFGSPSGEHYLVNLFQHGLIPYNVTHPGSHCAELQGALQCHTGLHMAPTWTTPFTAMFMHGGLLHLGGNMLFLWIFGNNVEDAMGSAKFLAFYVLGGLAAFALQILVSTGSGVPNIGASGAIAAVLGGYILLYPRARVLTFVFVVFFFTLVELPAFLVLGLWFAEQILFGSYGLNHGGSSGGVAYFAHIGGFAFGLVLIKAFAHRVKQVPPRLPVW
jgi:membrane associated rhomboid family serine protease